MISCASPPTLALPLKGGGDAFSKIPSPLKGEGWGGGDFLNVRLRF